MNLRSNCPDWFDDIQLRLDRFQGAGSVSCEAIRQWCQTFGLDHARRLRRRRDRMGDTWHLDKLFVTIQGR